MREVLLLACLFCGIWLGLLRSAHGQPAAAQTKAAAEALFEEGKELRSAGDCAAAIPKFEQSLALDVGVGTLLRLADCYEQTGRLASAWGSFRHAGSLAREQDDPRRAELAEERAAELEPKLARLKIDYGPNARIEGLNVRRGGVDLTPAMNGVALPVDAGTHEIVATAPGYQPLRVTVKVNSGDKSVIVKLRELERSAVAEPKPKPDPATGPAREEKVVHRWKQRVAALVLAAGSVGTGVVSAALLGAAAGLDEEADLHCDGVLCRDREGEELSHDALQLANLATAGFVISGVAAAGALVLMLTAPSAYETIVVVPDASPTSAGVQVRVRW